MASKLLKVVFDTFVWARDGPALAILTTPIFYIERHSMNEEDIHNQVDRHREEFTSMEIGYHASLQLFLSGTVVFVHSLLQTPGAIASFYNHRFFKDRTYALKKEDILRHYFLCVMNAKSGAKYERACNYAVSLKHLLTEDFLDEHEVVTVIENAGGIEDLYRDQVARKQIAKIGFSKLEIEGDEETLSHLFEQKVGSKAPILLERVEDGAGCWKRYRLVS